MLLRPPNSDARPRTIGDAFLRPGNNFDLLRLLAALAVLHHHSSSVVGARDPLRFWLGGYGNLGSHAIAAFFVISGFLVTRSVLERSPARYLASRAARVVPGLAVVIALQVLVLGPLVTNLPLGSYFADSRTWSHFNNAALFLGVQYDLPGVFREQPNLAVNASIWTLPVEATFYLMLLALALLRLLRPVLMLALLVVVYASQLVVRELFGITWSAPGPQIVPGVNIHALVTNGAWFVFGSVLWLWRDKIPLNGFLAVGAAILLLVAARTPMSSAVLFVTFPYLLMYAALGAPWTPGFVRKIGDLSYGTYLYAFPIQQTLVHVLGAEIDPWLVTALALPLVLLAAWLSWVLVERPFLRRSR